MSKVSILKLVGLGIVVTVMSAAAVAADASKVYPPWSQGKNNPVTQRGLEFTVPEVDNLPDFHGNPINPKLSIFVGGNYYFAMAPLVAAFEDEHPELRGKIYYETIPPGLLVRQIEQGGTITVGNMTWTVKADVYAAGMRRVKEMADKGLLTGGAVPYATNDLAIMVPHGNPAHITSLADLGKPGVRLVMPNPEFEGIGRQIKAALAKAGGAQLEKQVYEIKVNNGETLLTHIHHRQSPMYLMKGLADAGVTWKSEAIFQQKAGNPISFVPIPAEHNATAIYAAGVLKDAQNPEAAKAWVDFLKSPKALEIFGQYGFKPYHP
jgi:molybdenum ABC transporter molybdate-binding protein